MRKGFSIIELTITILFLAISFSAIFTGLRAHHTASHELFLRRAAIDKAISVLETETFHKESPLAIAEHARFGIEVGREELIPDLYKSVTVSVYVLDPRYNNQVVLNRKYYNREAE